MNSTPSEVIKYPKFPCLSVVTWISKNYNRIRLKSYEKNPSFLGKIVASLGHYQASLVIRLMMRGNTSLTAPTRKVSDKKRGLY